MPRILHTSDIHIGKVFEQFGNSISLKMASNSPKIRALRALDGRGWLSALMISALTGFRPVRAVYTYMGRLHRWCLVKRRKPLGGPIMWSISPRGREWLAWISRAKI
jgi:hypothetical protein